MALNAGEVLRALAWAGQHLSEVEGVEWVSWGEGGWSQDATGAGLFSASGSLPPKLGQALGPNRAGVTSCGPRLGTLPPPGPPTCSRSSLGPRGFAVQR